MALQRMINLVLELIYEQDFMDCSYGSRTNRLGYQALDRFWKPAMSMKGSRWRRPISEKSSTPSITAICPNCCASGCESECFFDASENEDMRA